MKIDFFALLLLTILLITLFFFTRKMVQEAIIKAKKQEDDASVFDRHVASQTLGSFVCGASVLSCLLCSVLTWKQIVLSVAIAVAFMVLILLIFRKKSNS